MMLHATSFIDSDRLEQEEYLCSVGGMSFEECGAGIEFDASAG